MNPVLESLGAHARSTPEHPALIGRHRRLSYGELFAAVREATEILRSKRVQRLGIMMDNGPGWAIWDLAAMAAGVISVPIGGFLSEAQRQHVVGDAGIEAIVDDRGDDIVVGGFPVGWLSMADRTGGVVPAGTVKITYTSGTTGQPKGVCLSLQAITRVAQSLLAVTGATRDDRHLATLPLSILLENLAGLYVPLMAGASVILEPLEQVGLTGSSRLDPKALHAALHRHGVSTCILMPAMLQALVERLQAGAPPLERLRLVAVGGAKVSGHLIGKARALGLPVCQGYGLSECASVVALSDLGDSDTENVGRVLPHLNVRLAPDGEILVKGHGFLGYVGDSTSAVPEWWPTGDLGSIDASGRLYVQGRKRNVFITAFGRNISPEWIEGELLAEPEILQAVVHGEAETHNTAIIVSSAGDEEIASAIDRVNRRLPDYARIGEWVRAAEPFTLHNGMATHNGRPRRETIVQHHLETRIR